MARKRKQIEQNFVGYPEEKKLVIPKSIRTMNDLNWGEKCFLSEIIAIDQASNEECYYSLRHLSKRFFVSTITIHNWTKKLVNLGFLEILTKLDEKNGYDRILKPTSFPFVAE